MFDTDSLKKSIGWELVVKVNDLLQSRNVSVFVVGGWVRDGLINKQSRDIDFAVTGDGLEAAQQAAEALGGKFVLLDSVNRVGRVVLVGDSLSTEGNRTLDFATIAGDTIEEDLHRRDFTIDAIAISPMAMMGGTIKAIDPWHGMEDLDNGTLRATTKAVFSEDPVRLLRAVRLAAQMGFQIDPDTESMIRHDAGLIVQSSGERIREELMLLLSVPGSGRFLTYLDELGLLISVIPELEITREAEQPKEHQWKVLRHSLETVKALDFLLRENNWEYADASANEMVLQTVPWTADNSEYFKAGAGYQSTREALFRLAAVLHDNAKPQTMTVEPEGKVRFLGHAQQGAEIAQVIMERLRFSTREIKLVATAVKHHLRPTQMGWPELPTRRAIYRYFRDTGEAARGVLFLSLADHMATRGPTLDVDNWRIHTRITESILAQEKEIPSPKQMLIDGYDIMNRFGLNPGRRVGELLELVHEAQASGQVSTKDGALALIREMMDKPSEPDQGEGGD
jgi:poly(A) polymerase